MICREREKSLTKPAIRHLIISLKHLINPLCLVKKYQIGSSLTVGLLNIRRYGSVYHFSEVQCIFGYLNLFGAEVVWISE